MQKGYAMTESASIGDNAKQKLRSIVERVENLDEQIKGLRSDQKDIYQEAKSSGFDLKAIRTIVRMRTMDDEKRRNEEAVLESYMMALGMI